MSKLHKNEVCKSDKVQLAKLQIENEKIALTKKQEL